MAVIHGDSGNFDKEVKKSKVPVLVDFYADWCGPCRKLGPVLEQLDKEMGGKLKVVKINVDEARELAAAHEVMHIPALFIYKGGKIVSSDTGSHPLPLLKAWVEQVL